MIKIKICGVTNYDDALLVANIGAEYVGFNFWKDSPRKISVKLAKEIIAKLPPFITPVGVFVDEEINTVVKTAKKSGIKAVQLHGSEGPDYCLQLKAACSLPLIKAFRISDENSIAQVSSYADAADYFLLDAYVPGEQGGTGEIFNWDLALKVKELNKPVFLAGGLTQENVSDAVKKVLPFAVDVASGVERLPRRKDYDKMKSFVKAARGL